MGWLDARCHELRTQRIATADVRHRRRTRSDRIYLDHLEGYRGSNPVRIGNGQPGQNQLDIYGELLDAISSPTASTISYDLWSTAAPPARVARTALAGADEGIWEVRGGPKLFVHSRLMSLGCLRSGTPSGPRRRGLPAPVEQWKHIQRAHLQGASRSRAGARTSTASSSITAATQSMPPLC